MKISEVGKTTVSSVLTFLETAPADELYTSQELSEKFNIPISTLRHSTLLWKSKYRIRFSERTYYGSLAAITEVNKQQETK